MELNRIINQLIENISNTKTIKDPFVHKFVKNVFPNDFYKILLNNIPNKDLYNPINASGAVNSRYSDERFIFNFTEENELKKLNTNQYVFFKNLNKILFSELFFNSVTSIFKETLDNRLLNLSEEEKKQINFPNLKFNFRTALIKDITKYSLGAHTDSFLKFITFLFYIPANDNLKKNGTCLYKPLTDIKDTKHFSLSETKKQFKKIKTCPFIPNSLLIFPRTELSFHGVEEVNILQKERNVLLLNYNLEKTQDS